MNPLFQPRPEHWPRFTLKGLLIVVALSALATFWGIREYNRHQWTEREREFIRDSQIYRVPVWDLDKP